MTRLLLFTCLLFHRNISAGQTVTPPYLLSSASTSLSVSQSFQDHPCWYWPVFNDLTFTAPIPYNNTISFSFSNPSHLSRKYTYGDLKPGKWFTPNPTISTTSPPNSHPHHSEDYGAIGIYPMTTGENGIIKFSKPTSTGFYLHIYQTVSSIKFDHLFTVISTDKDLHTESSGGLKNNVLVPDIAAGSSDDANATIYFNAGLTELKFSILNASPIPDGVQFAFTFPDNCIYEPSVDFSYSLIDCNNLDLKLTKKEYINKIKWDFGDKTTSTKETIEHRYKKEGTYIIKLTATAVDGKEIILSKQVVIKKPVADFSFAINNEERTVRFKIEAKEKLKYKWLFGDGETSLKEKKITHTYAEPGTYTALLIAENKNGCRDTASKDIVITQPTILLPNSFVISTADTVLKGNEPEIILEKRENNLIKQIEVTHDSVAVSFYDNAEIDGDSVTIVYNDSIIITHLRLTEKPRSFMLPVNKESSSNQLIMYAENLGSIPPNTALMIIYDGDKRHELSITSSKSANGMVSFVFHR